MSSHPVYELKSSQCSGTYYGEPKRPFPLCYRYGIKEVKRTKKQNIKNLLIRRS